jgi:hypothetical protein
MPPRYSVTAMAKMPKGAGYGALDDRRTVRIVQRRAKMSFSTMLDYQRISVTRKILQRKTSRFKLLTGRLAYCGLLVTLENVGSADLRFKRKLGLVVNKRFDNHLKSI